jgi:hypothetical protein
MGRKDKLRKEKKNKKETIKKIQLYTKQERQQKITNMRIELSMLDMDHVITDQIKQSMNNFVETGNTTEIEHPLEQYGRTLIIKLYNDKSLNSFMNLRFDYSPVSSGNPDDPVVKFNNRLQELKDQGFELTH